MGKKNAVGFLPFKNQPYFNLDSRFSRERQVCCHIIQKETVQHDKNFKKVLYYSMYGHVETMAKAVAEGVRSVEDTEGHHKRRVPDLVRKSGHAK
ncbi:hypothetical protein [Candidatus Kuenenia stuttgartiensis]|uniref:hypothetical protein n=1 Tax=Kuenenia stuttgartiensis TaxID=174633 RepID=UPI00146F13B5|nr:hypothetical protein [Candidatus Kuenenia stuttgartiensis]